jgi:hypothetical protein
MRRSAAWLAVLVVIAFIAGSSAAASAARTAGSAPGWRIVEIFPVGSTVDHLAASGPRDVWAVESCRKPCVSSDGLILRRWTGTAWQPQPQSTVSKHTGNAEPALAMPPGSPVLWAVYGLYDGQPRATAVGWTGSSWDAPTVFLATHPLGLEVVAPSPSSAWLFTGLGTQVSYRYNGKTWSTAPSPDINLGSTGVVAMSPDDIWAFGIDPKRFGAAVTRWTGTRWVRQALPAAPHGIDVITGGGLIASGRTGIWGFGYTDTKTGTDWLVHWNGTAWSNVKVPFQLSKTFGGGFIGSDGRGGVWFEAVAAGGSREVLYHDTASGQWSTQPIPAPAWTTTVIYGFAQVPGTTTVYAYGTATNPRNGATEGVILKHT